MIAAGPHRDGWTSQFDDGYQAVLGAIRHGALDHDLDHDELALSGRFHLDPVVLRALLERLADNGLVVPSGAAAVRIRTLSVPAWVDNSRLLIGLMEGVMRSAAKTLSDDAVSAQVTVTSDLRRAATLRTPDLDPAFWASLRFWIDRTPNRVLARLADRTLERVRFGIDPLMPFRSTRVDEWVAASEQAVRYPGVESAERAAHVLVALWEAQLEDVAMILNGTGAVRLSAASTSERDDLPAWATWTPDDLWWDLLAIVRDGTLERGRTYRARDIATRLRRSTRVLMPLLRRLELLGLVATRPDDPEGIRISNPDVRHWIDSLQLATTLTEMAVQWAIPSLTEPGQSQLRQVIATIRRQARTRDHAYTASMVELSRVLAAHTPNPWVAGNLRLALTRLAYVFDDAPPLRQWNIDDVLTLLDDAIDARDADIGADAMHALAIHYDAHVAEVTARRMT